MLSRLARCVLYRRRCNGHSLLLNYCLSKIDRIENPYCSALGHPIQDSSDLIMHFQLRMSCTVCFLAALAIATTSDLSFGKLPGFLGYMVFLCPIPLKGLGNNNTSLCQSDELLYFFCSFLSILSKPRNPTSTLLPLSRSLDNLLCDRIDLTLGPAFTQLLTRTLAVVQLRSSNRVYYFLSFPLSLSLLNFLL